MNNRINPAKKGLTVKDLVTTGIFSAIFLVFTLIGSILFAPNPVLTFYMPMGAALLCGPVYLLMIAKVQKRWSVTILGIVMGIIWFVTGMHWAFSLGYIGMGIIADLVAGAGHYRNKVVNLLSYMLMSLGSVYTYVVFFIDPQGWASTMLENGTEQSYIDTMSASAPSWLLAVTHRSRTMSISEQRAELTSSRATETGRKKKPVSFWHGALYSSAELWRAQWRILYFTTLPRPSSV